MYFVKADQNGLGLPPHAHQEQFDYPYDTKCGKQTRLLLFDVKETYNIPCRNWGEEFKGFKNQQLPTNCPDGRTSKVYFLGESIVLFKVTSVMSGLKSNKVSSLIILFLRDSKVNHD